jgi:hypothetical protein
MDDAAGIPGAIEDILKPQAKRFREAYALTGKAAD